MLGPLACQEVGHGALVEQVELGARVGDYLAVAAPLQRAHQRRADHAAVAGHVDEAVLVDHRPLFQRSPLMAYAPGQCAQSKRLSTMPLSMKNSSAARLSPSQGRTP